LSEIDLRKSDFYTQGNKKIKKLCEKLKLDSSQVLKAWKKVKIVKMADSNLEEFQFKKLILSQDEIRDIHLLVETYLSLPLSTVNCKRVFSRANLIKTDTKSCLSTDVLNHLLQKAIIGPEIEEYDFGSCIADWK